MKIKVGEYVRTKNGHIGKIIKLSNVKGIFYIQYYIDGMEFKTDIEETPIKAHSPNIIDLIEVGDYVNGEQIDFINISKAGNKRLLIRDNIYFFDKYSSIKSIVTKEQFKEMEYRV